MRIPVAWLNILQHKKRTAAAVAGISFSILLIFMQVGFLGAAKKNATVAFDIFDFDLMITSRGFITLRMAGSVDRYRLIQAEAVEGVKRTTGVTVKNGDWINRDDNKEKKLMIMSVDPDVNPLLDTTIRPQIDTLKMENSLLMDTRSMASFGPWEVGGEGTVNSMTVDIVGAYGMGTGILADGSAIVSHETFSRLNEMPAMTEFDLGLVQLEPGADIESIQAKLESVLPKDVYVRTRASILESEEVYYVQVKPVGVMFQVGAAVAFIVGAVILYQILSAEITNRLREFATMKAMGYASSYIYRIGIQQGVIFSMMGYVPAFFLSFLLYQFLYSISGFHLTMTLSRASFVFVLALVMCAIAAALSLGKIRKADPADLF